MPSFSCGHKLPKSRVGANLSHIPQDNCKRCPDCQTKTAAGTLRLLMNLQKPCENEKRLDPNINQYLITYTFDRFVLQRKMTSNGFKQNFNKLLCICGEVSLHLLGRKQLSSFILTTKGRWGRNIAKQTLRAVGTAALKANGVYTLIEPVDSEILTTLNRMIILCRERVAAIEVFEHLEIILDSATVLKSMQDEVIFALSRLEDGFTKWDSIGC
ncbi:hypothetical protein F4776DRAFT_641130 [Hypoxylon sp. NC0597]|nr:hypothetical protein F4776DRAFT_641130 [Hypoxylon sp. NC0597]